MMPTLYLAHCFRRRDEVKEHQLVIESWGYAIINPFDSSNESRELSQMWRDGIYQGDEEKLRSICSRIFKKDIKFIEQSQIVLAFYLEESTGTACELAIAHNMGKPLIVVTNMVHPFIYGQATHVIKYRPGFLDELRAVLRQYRTTLPPRPCPYCKGEGYESPEMDILRVCPKCGGTGIV